MNNQIKILLSIQGIEGRDLKPTGTIKGKLIITKKDIDPYYKGKDADKPVRYINYRYTDKECIPCSRTIKLTQDAYDAFTSTEYPSWFHGNWKKLTKTQRLEMHLARTCEYFGGKSYTYSILEE